MADPKTLSTAVENARRGALPGVAVLSAVPESVGLAREFAKRRLGDLHPVLHDVTLLVSELVTNAVLHSDSGRGGSVTVALVDCPDHVHVAVVDAGGVGVPQVRAGALSEGGRGLWLVEAIAQAWGIHDHDGGRTVWFQVGHRRTGAVKAGCGAPEFSPLT
ncbi:ATP-binding protein [Sphaerisporangium sp. B11E5]|uniref:ATP-binding protein n=1 Tax=Sphaerisporangium sp. B11E5 TaxID=3153563 RepID=UPI00325EEB53